MRGEARRGDGKWRLRHAEEVPRPPRHYRWQYFGVQRQELELERARALQWTIDDGYQNRANQIKSNQCWKGDQCAQQSKGGPAVQPQLYISCSQASYLVTVAATGLAAADTAVEAAVVGLGAGEGVGEAAGSRTSWSVAVVCSAMPKLRHQEGKHELSRQGRSTR
ncbi:hypothetical protein V8C34DRAFT_192204 [Trichoderma compactum]